MVDRPLQPTWSGYVATARDALILFEACLNGVLRHASRRLHKKERAHFIRNGSIFVFEEQNVGIQRWTDGVLWGPSRIRGDFVVYQQVSKQGRAKRPSKRKKEQNTVVKPPNYPRIGKSTSSGLPLHRSSADPHGEHSLMKKTISINLRGVVYRLVSYYTTEDCRQPKLWTPTDDQYLRYIEPRDDLITARIWRVSVNEADLAMDVVGEAQHSSRWYQHRQLDSLQERSHHVHQATEPPTGPTFNPFAPIGIALQHDPSYTHEAQSSDYSACTQADSTSQKTVHRNVEPSYKSYDFTQFWQNSFSHDFLTPTVQTTVDCAQLTKEPLLELCQTQWF